MGAWTEARGAARDLSDALVRTAYRGAYSLAMAYWFVRRPQTEGVFVGVWHGRRVLLLQNSYKRFFSMPGGGPHKGESHLQTALRELREEVGLTPSTPTLRAAFDVVDTGEYKHDHVYFLELEVDTEPSLTIDRREVVWASFFDVEAALQLPLSSPIRAYLTEAARRHTRPELHFISPGHSLYPEELELRFRVLREPLGLARSEVTFPFEDQSLHLVASQAGTVVGCVLFHPEDAHGGRLFQMAVTPALQGRGLGARLVTALEEELRRRGFTHVHLHARANVVPFYERLGYEVYGEPFTERTIPHRHMRKTLASSILEGSRSKEA
jgi:8-oxo-dGTP pyrophosphatase MutT (NUDIX family)/N-acetylglutamate synthase-like GNAT family acetyltransferase